MTPAPVAAARNTKSAAGNRIMTDEELQRELQNISESLDRLADSDEPLTKQEKRRKQFLLLKKQTLQQIKQAKEKKDFIQESDHTVTYGLLTSVGEKHPFLMGLLRSKFKWHVF